MHSIFNLHFTPSLNFGVKNTHRNLLVLVELLDKGKQPDAGCLPDVGVLAGYILGQDGVKDPGNHIIVFYICQQKGKSGN